MRMPRYKTRVGFGHLGYARDARQLLTSSVYRAIAELLPAFPWTYGLLTLRSHRKGQSR